MLFLENNNLTYAVPGEDRIKLLQALQDQDFTPLIRSARVHCFDLLAGSDRSGEIEPIIAYWTEQTLKEPFVPGDVFCFQDYVLFLTFEDDDEKPLVCAGIVFEPETAEPFRKLDSFCRTVREMLISQTEHGGNAPFEFPQWQSGNQNIPQGFREFIAKRDTDSMYTSLRKETLRKRVLAASNLEDEGARVFCALLATHTLKVMRRNCSLEALRRTTYPYRGSRTSD